MTPLPALTSVPEGLIHCAIIPFKTPQIDLDKFAQVIEFLLCQNAAALCVNYTLQKALLYL
jgi:dihydrodipicolinate synthase/N-acetylneuraminate lyase